MKLGGANRTKFLVMALLAAVAALVVFNLFTESSPQAAAPLAQANAGQPSRGSLVNTLDPTLRLDLLKSSASVEYKGSGRNIFKAEPDPPPPKPIQPVITYGPPKPPPPPPINLKFYGFASRPGEPKRVFLSEGDDIFIAREGDIVDRHYRIDRIEPNLVQVTDVLNNNTQPIPLTEGGPPQPQ